jgi:hypothetical protein
MKLESEGQNRLTADKTWDNASSIKGIEGSRLLERNSKLSF